MSESRRRHRTEFALLERILYQRLPHRKSTEWNSSTMIVALLTVCLIALSEVSADPCVGYETITDQRRSARYTAKSDEPNICDSQDIDESKWYRFLVLPPSQMYSRCIHGKKCGTDSPVFMNGDHHPTANDPGPKDVQVCSSQDGVCCKAWDSTIKVKFCRADDGDDDGDFYVYQLKRVPRCDMAYCAGEALVCKKGEVYNPNSETCTEPSPKIVAPLFKNPSFVKKTLKADGKTYDDFYITCEVHFDQVDPDAARKGQSIEVVFTFDGQEIESCVQPIIVDGINDKEVKLWSSQLKGHCLNKAVSCMVRSFWKKLEKHKSEFMAANEDFYIGIRYSLTNKPGSFTNPPIELNEGDPPLALFFRSTVPISCPDVEYETSCKVTIQIEDIPATDRIGVGSCSIVFNGLESTGKVSTPQSVKALLTAGMHHRMPVIRFKPVVGDKNFFWNNYRLPDIVVKVTDSTTQMWCSSTGDPHIRAFDGRTFDDMTIGDYILAKSAVGTFEVHVRQFPCGTVACNCGVAVREGNDVIGITVCDGHALMPIAFSIGKSSGAVITNNANQYTIAMASGAYVEVHTYGTFVNIFVYENSKNLQGSTGICGAPGSYYRLRPEDSLLNAHIYGIKCLDNTDIESVCSCRPPFGCRAPQVNQNQIAATAVTQFTRKCQKEKENEFGRNFRRKRREAGKNETNNDDDELYEMMITPDEFPVQKVDVNHGKNYTLKWPTPSGVTQDEAFRRCRTELGKSPVFDLCKSRVNNSDGIINDCVTDIQIMDNTDLAVSYVIDSFQKRCITVLENAVITNHTNETVSDPPSEAEILLFEISSQICPNQCNGNGFCVNGTCRCNNGYAGDDCSTNIRNPPDLEDIRKGSLCDSRTSVCTVAFIFAKNFYRSSGLLCKITEAKKPREFNLPGSMVSEQMLSCRLPLVHRFTNKSHLRAKKSVDLAPAPFYRWEISVSNDAGKLFSKSLPLTVYDSKCQICNNNGNCVRKNNTCEIDGRCYAAKEVSSHDRSLGCIPSESQEKWSICKPSDGCGNASIIRTGRRMTIAVFALIAFITKTLY